jgi:hypothetical protein
MKTKKYFSTICLLVLYLLLCAVQAQERIPVSTFDTMATSRNLLKFDPLVTNYWAHTEPASSTNPANGNNIVIGFNSTYPQTYPTIITQGAKFSNDGGLTWTVVDSLPKARGSGYASDPGCAFSTNGTAYISYVTYGGGQQYQVRYSYSTNGGASWSDPVSVYSTSEQVDRPNMCIDNKVGSPYQDRLYFAWSRAVGGYLASGILFTTPSITGSQTISSDIGWGVSLATDNNGKLYVVWCDFNGNVRMNRSTNGGSSFTGTTTVQSGLINPVSIGGLGARYYPVVAVDRSTYHPNRVYVAYHSGPSTDIDVFITYSDDGGNTWSSPKQVNDDKVQDGQSNGKSQWHPWMTVDGSGIVHVTFYDNRNGSTNTSVQAYYAYSTDGAQSFINQASNSGQFTLTTIPGLRSDYYSDYNAITVSSGLAIASWAQPLTKGYDIVSQRIPRDVSVLVSNKVNGITDYNSTLTINGQVVNSGASITLTDGIIYPGKTNSERLQGDNKHKDWDGNATEYRLLENFRVKRAVPTRDANFIGLNPVTVTTQLLETSGSGGNVEFRDPWYLADASGNQPNQFFPYSAPHSPTGAYNQTTGGVFLNQNPSFDPTLPIYSLRAISPQQITINGRIHSFYFQGWSASPDGSAEFQNANALETPVVFKNPGAVVSANYKGTQLSNNKNTFSNNSQRKFVRSNYNRMLHIVYESMGKIWYETSTDNGITWQIRNGGKSLSNTEAKNPSIFIINDFHTHSVVAIVFQERNGDFYNIKALIYNTYSDSIMDVSLIKTVLKPYSENANPVIAFGHNIIVVWQEGYGNYWEPQGLYYVYGEIGLGYKFRWTDTTYLHYPFTDTNTENVNPTISRVDDVPVNIFHLAWEARNRRGTSDIMFCKITSDNNVTIINDVMNISYGNGFRYNHSPSIISVKDKDRKEFAIVCWIGEREDWPNSINPQMQKQVILTSTSRPGIFKAFGENVSSVSINKSSTRWTVGWSRSNDLPLQYTDSRGVSIYQLDVYGEYIQIGDGILPEQMYALAFNTRALPYTINTKQIYPQYIPTEVISTTKLREGVVSKDGVQIYYSIGDIKVGNEKIDFIEMPDTIKINTLQDANYYLVSEPFELDDNSEFYYTIKFGISDSNAVKQALSENEFINFSVELIDAITNELLGVLNEVTYDQHNVAQYNEVSYQVNTSGIGNRVVRLRLVITNNIDPHYAIFDKYFDESVSLAKRQIKQINYKGKLEIKDYALYQNYPNPFNPVTKIRFSIKETNPVKIKLYDIVGREVAVIMNEVKDAGEYEIELDAGKLGISSGVYFYQMKAGDYTSIKKMVYLK